MAGYYYTTAADTTYSTWVTASNTTAATPIYSTWVTNGTTSSSITNQVYYLWTIMPNGTSQVVQQQWSYQPYQPTEEQLRQAAEQRARLAEEQAERDRLRAEAAERARDLLLAHLTPEQRHEYETLQAFRLIVGEKTYRIRRGIAGNVDLLGADGEPDAQFCIHPREDVPAEDNMLAQKLLLENDEPSFVRIANKTTLRRAA